MSTKQYHHHDHNDHYYHQDSQLFLIRVWSGEGSDGEVEWQGKLQHVVSGEAHTFHNWPTLIDLLLQMAEIDRIESDPPGLGSGSKEVTR